MYVSVKAKKTLNLFNSHKFSELDLVKKANCRKTVDLHNLCGFICAFCGQSG